MSPEQRPNTNVHDIVPKGEGVLPPADTPLSPAFETYTIPSERPPRPSEVLGNTTDFSTSRRRGIKIAAATLALATATGIGIGVGRRGHSETTAIIPRSPAVSASLAPSELPTTEPTPEVVDGLLEDLTVDNFPYVIEGVPYNGFSDLEEKYGITTEKYPDPADAVKQMIHVLNVWVNIDMTDEQRAEYATIKYTNERGEFGGSAAVMFRYVNEAFSRIIAHSQPNLKGAEYPAGLLKKYGDLAVDNVGLRWLTRDEPTPYKGKFVIQKAPAVSIGGAIPAGGEYAIVDMIMRYTDNADKNGVGEAYPRSRQYNNVADPRAFVFAVDRSEQDDGCWKIASAREVRL
jgi:hypothetical protein